jgi:high-affinity Fe2+/Pb2+ permease
MLHDHHNSGILEMGTAWITLALVLAYMLWQFISPHIPWTIVIFHLL